MEKSTLPYDKNLIGKLISAGAESVVYQYDIDKVIKFPTFYSLRFFWDSSKYCSELKNGFAILNQYLRHHLNESSLHFYEKNNKSTYVIIEPFINGLALTRKDMASENIKSQLYDIIGIKDELEKKERLFLDLFGLWGLLFFGHKKIPNLLIERNTQKVYLVDIGTARLDDSRFIVSILLKFAHWQQNRLLKYYLK